MRRVGHVFDRVADFGALCAAAQRAARGKRRRPDVAEFMMDLEPRAFALERALLDGSWRPGPLRTFVISQPKARRISAAPFADRVVHHAVCAAMEPTLERYAVRDSFACRPGKGVRAAVLRAQHHARRHPWFLGLDVRHFFETLPHATIRSNLARRFKDERLLALLDVILDAGGVEGAGLPIGNLTSQHLGNLALGAVDHHVLEVLGVPGYCRYMDDMIFFGPGRAAAARCRARVALFLDNELGLSLRHDATRRGPVAAGVPFLGFRVWPRQVRLDGPRRRRLLRRLGALDDAVHRDAVSEDEAARAASGLLGWARHADTRRLLVARERRRRTTRAPP